MTNKLNVSVKSAQFIWALFFSAVLFLSLTQLHANKWAVTFACSMILIAYAIYTNGDTLEKHKPGFLVFALLFIYSTTMSTNTGRSAFIAPTYLFSYLFFITLSDAQHRFSSLSAAEGSRASRNYINICKIIVLILALANSLLSFWQYFDTHARALGVFQDFGQSALFTLLAFGLNYPLLKKKTALKAFLTLILFLGFFSAFSRAGNFLLLFLLITLLILNVKVKKDHQLIALALVITIAYLVVYITPLLSGVATLDRDTAAQIGTLNSRLFYWDAAIVAIKANPLWGTGPGNFEYLGIKQVLPFNLTNSTHNDYLQIWVDLGVFWFIGFVASILFFVIYFFPIRLRRKHVKPNVEQVASYAEAMSTQAIYWSLLVCVALYMLINFAINAFIFQLVFVILLVELTASKKAKEALLKDD